MKTLKLIADDHWGISLSQNRWGNDQNYTNSSASSKGVGRGKGGNPPPPETGKIVVENGVISESSIFSNKF